MEELYQSLWNGDPSIWWYSHLFTRQLLLLYLKLSLQSYSCITPAATTASLIVVPKMIPLLTLVRTMPFGRIREYLTKFCHCKILFTLLLLLISWSTQSSCLSTMLPLVNWKSLLPNWKCPHLLSLFLSISWNTQSSCPCNRSSTIATSKWMKCPPLLSLSCFISLGVLNKAILVTARGSSPLSNELRIYLCPLIYRNTILYVFVKSIYYAE